MIPATSNTAIHDETDDVSAGPKMIERLNEGPDLDLPPINYPIIFKLKNPLSVPFDKRQNVGHGATNSGKREIHELELQAPIGRMFMRYGPFQRPITRERTDPLTREITIDRFTEVNYPALLNYAADMSGVALKYLEEMHAVDVERLGAVVVRLMYGIPS